MPQELVPTLGFGEADEPTTVYLTLGLGGPSPDPEEVTTGTCEFTLDSVEHPKLRVLRVRFTQVPNTTDSVLVRADIPSKYTLTPTSGQAAAPAILAASAATDDSEVIDLHMAGELPLGTWQLAVDPGVQDADHGPLVGSGIAAFEVLRITQDDLGGGAITRDHFAEISSLFHPALRRGTNWRGIMAGLAAGDAIVADQANKAFDQLFVQSASGKYLEQRAAERGIPKYVDVGMIDPTFRTFVTAVHNEKLTQGAYLRALESFYGASAVRAWADTGHFEPFVLVDGATLDILIDEKYNVTWRVARREYRIMRRATAEEVAVSITRALEAAGVPQAYAVPVTDADTGVVRVRVYSGSRGLASSVRFIGGTLLPVMDFPTDVFPVPDPSPGLPVWEVVPAADGTARYYPDDDVLFNLGSVVEGDILVVTCDLSPPNRGAFEIIAVRYAYESGTLRQYVEVRNPNAVAETVQQVHDHSVKIYRPTRRTVLDAPNYVVVDSHDGRARVSLPVTTEAVERHALTGSYINAAAGIEVEEWTRDSEGLVVATTADPHGLEPGDWFDFDPLGQVYGPGPVPGAGTPAGAMSADDAAAGESDVSWVTRWHRDTTISAADASTVTDLDGDVWVIGGGTYAAGAFSPRHDAAVFSAIREDLSRDRASHSYQWHGVEMGSAVSTGIALGVRTQPAAQVNDVMAVGGYTTSHWALKDTTDAVAAVRRIRKVVSEGDVLVAGQLSDTEGVLAALVVVLTTQPASGNLLRITDGVTTRTYGFGSGGDVTVTIGANVAATSTNLATAINGDGSADWSGTYTAGLGVVIVEDAVLTSKSGLRVWSPSGGLVGKASVIAFGDAVTVHLDYSDGTTAAIASADPGNGRAGYHRAVFTLSDAETYRVVWPTTNFYAWDEGGGVWQTTVGWGLVTTDGGDLAVRVADAAVDTKSAPASIVVCGGSTLINNADSTIQVGNGTTNFVDVGDLKYARTQARIVPCVGVGVGTERMLISGGRQPCTLVRSGFTNWEFEDSGTTLTGPVSVALSGNPRPAGKLGHGVAFSVTSSAASAGAPQTALNAVLRPSGANAVTVAGWVTSHLGTVFSCRSTGAWAAPADNCLLEFGINTDDHFFVRWETGLITQDPVYLEVTSTTRTELWGATPADTTYNRYHHFAITRGALDGGSVDVRLYLDGILVGTWLNQAPAASGANAVWQFGVDTSGISLRFAGAVDLVGVAATELSAAEVKRQFELEVGVTYDNPRGLDLSPVGRVLSSCEVITALGGSIVTGGMAYARFGHGLVALPDGRIVAIGGIGYRASLGDAYPATRSQRQLELRSAEIYDPYSGLWNPLPDMTDAHSWGLAAYDAESNRVYVSGGFSSLKTEYLDVDTLTWHVSTAVNTVASGHAAGGLTESRVLVLAGGVTASSTGVPSTSAGDVSADVLEETTRSGGVAGRFVAAAGTTGSTLVYVARPGWSESSEGGVVTPVAAPEGMSDVPGPFIFDPRLGFGISATSGNLGRRVEVDHRYPTLYLGAGEADLFPDEPGYLVVGFGYSYEVTSVPYLGRLGSDALAIHAGFKWPKTIEVGAEVRLLWTRAPYLPEDPAAVGAFYATASAAGRVAAVDTLAKISPAGIPLDVEVRYSGDRGLGGEGYPTRGNYKLSDITEVFTHNRIDEEMAQYREGEEVL